MKNQTPSQDRFIHPRVLVGASDLAVLREKIGKQPFAEMFNRLLEDAEKDNWARKPASEPFDFHFVAHRYAFLYVLTGDDSYASKSRAIVEKIIDSDEWANERVKGLMLYTAGVNVSYAYDHCYGAPSWIGEFSRKVSKRIREMADVIFKNGGTEQNQSDASNWQGLRFSTAGICYLATDEGDVAEDDLNSCYDRVARYLRANLGEDSESRGWNIEGLGYTYYPMGGGVAPFAIAMQRRDPSKDVRKDVPASRWTLWTCYATLTKTPLGLIHPDFGDDNPAADGEGAYAFAFWFCPAEIQAGLKWWYDRTVGLKGDRTFDSARFGTAASILYYPANLPEEDPMKISAWREALIERGGNGYAVFRNRYRDYSDITAQLYAKVRGARGHNGPDALSFRLVGLDTIWATGCGRYGLKTGDLDVYKRSQNTLYPVSPDSTFTTNNNSGEFVDCSDLRVDGGGEVILHIDENNVGTRDHTRRFLADYTDSGAAAAFIISDTSKNGVFWQFNTLETNTIEITGNTFTVTSPTGSTMRAAVIYPDLVDFQIGVRPRGSDAVGVSNNRFVIFHSEDGCYLVVLTLAGPGKPHPLVNAAGRWTHNPEGIVRIGDLKITVKGNSLFRD